MRIPDKRIGRVMAFSRHDANVVMGRSMLQLRSSILAGQSLHNG